MEQPTDRGGSIFRSVDWWTVAIYIALLTFGWVSVCGASYTFGETEILSMDSRSGMQLMWIGTSIVLGFALFMTEERYYDMFAYIIYALMLLLLFATIFNPHEIKGSRSWIVIGPLRLQPAEFAKFATALAVSKLMSTYGYNIHQWKHFAAAIGVVMLPMLFIVAQKETGSALVYLAFFLMFYREGMPGSILFTGVAMVFYFVVGVKYAGVQLWGTPTSLGEFAVMLSAQLFTAGMVRVYTREQQQATLMIAFCTGTTLLALLVSKFIIPFNIYWVQLAVCVFMALWLLWLWLGARVRNYLFIAMFLLGSMVFFNATSYVLNDVMQPHQRTRINVLLGLEEDLRGAGYNVHQSEIAIGSGGLRGKGFLNGTQTKLKFVPEQDTDFIFCTVGEEEGFVGSASVLLLFLALILRLIHLAERQPHAFGRIYGYCVLSIFLFHVFINVGMVLGLTPVIGIPLPFFSYGGSSLWGFTILLFIFLRIDADRNKNRR